MPARNDALKDRLSRYREIKITVTGRSSGRPISFPVWFVLDQEKLYLLPGYGSNTQWYKNVLKNPSIRVNARGAEVEFNVVPVTALLQSFVSEPLLDIGKVGRDPQSFENNGGGNE